jgi:hypothetical protein
MRLGLEFLKLDNELPELKAVRTSHSRMFLWHGTKTNLKTVYEKGLTIAANASSEARLKDNKKAIWLTPSYAYAKAYGTPILVHVHTKDLEFMERLPFNKTVNEYVYYSDIPPKDVITYLNK